jgi:hypothetical protein
MAAAASRATFYPIGCHSAAHGALACLEQIRCPLARFYQWQINQWQINAKGYEGPNPATDLKLFLGRQPSLGSCPRDPQWFRRDEARRLLVACRAPPLRHSFGEHEGRTETSCTSVTSARSMLWTRVRDSMIPTLETLRTCATRSCRMLQNAVGHVPLRPSRRLACRKHWTHDRQHSQQQVADRRGPSAKRGPRTPPTESLLLLARDLTAGRIALRAVAAVVRHRARNQRSHVHRSHLLPRAARADRDGFDGARDRARRRPREDHPLGELAGALEHPWEQRRHVDRNVRPARRTPLRSIGRSTARDDCGWRAADSLAAADGPRESLRRGPGPSRVVRREARRTAFVATAVERKMHELGDKLSAAANLRAAGDGVFGQDRRPPATFTTADPAASRGTAAGRSRAEARSSSPARRHARRSRGAGRSRRTPGPDRTPGP